jgi:hypothetical protein
MNQNQHKFEENAEKDLEKSSLEEFFSHFMKNSDHFVWELPFLII